MMSATDLFSQEKNIKAIQWKIAAKLQNEDGSISLGFAGAINGISNNALIVSGGANFQDKMPWEGGKKHFSNEIHILQKRNKNYFWNNNNKQRLPEPIAYCGNTTTDLGIVYAGGENENGLSNRAFIIKWNEDKNEVEIKALPNLPVPITNIGLTHINNTVYAIGGDEASNSSNQFLSLDLNNPNAEWKSLPQLPFALANAVVIAQKDKDETTIYVIGGRTKTASGISELHNTTLVFNIKKKIWESRAKISDGEKTTNFSAGAGVAWGDHSILILGGDNGITFNKIETYLSQIAKTDSQELKDKFIAEKNLLLTNHKGFYNAMLLYNTKTDSWSTIGELPFLPHVTTTATIWNGKIVFSNGEVKPGVRTPDVMIGKIK